MKTITPAAESSGIDPRWRRVASVNGVLVLLFLAAMLSAAVSFPGPRFDEPFFIRNCELFSQVGLSKRFLLEMREQAPGPTFQIVHFVLSAFTGYNAVWMRLMTIGMLFATVAASRRWPYDRPREDYATHALRFLAVPTTWVFGTMALTQMPAMLCAVGFLLVWSRGRGPAPAVTAGVLLGLATLGRVHYAALVLLCVFDVIRRRDRYAFLRNVGVATTAAAVCLPVFLVWGGYVPPDQRAIFADGGRLHVRSLFIACNYLFLFTLIDRPGFLRRRELWPFLLVLPACIAMNAVLGTLPQESKVMSTLLFFLPRSVVAAIPVPVYSAVALVTVAHYVDSKGLRSFTPRAALGLIIVATMMSGLRSSRFSDGYVLQILPMMLAYHGPDERAGYRLPKSLALGCLGLAYLVHRLRGF